MKQAELTAGAVLAYSQRRDGREPHAVLLLDTQIWSKERIGTELTYRPNPGAWSKGVGNGRGRPTKDIADRSGYPVIVLPAVTLDADVTAQLIASGTEVARTVFDEEGRLLRDRLPRAAYFDLVDSLYLRGPWEEAQRAERQRREAEEHRQAARERTVSELTARFDAAREILMLIYPMTATITQKPDLLTVEMPLTVFEELVRHQLRSS